MIDADTNKRLRELAVRIAEERDHDTFTRLIAEFNQLLEGKLQSPDRLEKTKP